MKHCLKLSIDEGQVGKDPEAVNVLSSMLNQLGVQTEIADDQIRISWDDDIVREKISRSAGRPKTQALIRIDEVLPLLGDYYDLHGDDKYTFVKSQLGISERTFRRRLKYFEDRGFSSLKKARDAGYFYFIDDEEKSKGV